jgi:hypothetical protein
MVVRGRRGAVSRRMECRHFPNSFADRGKYDAKLGGPMTYGYRIDAVDAAA